MSDRPAIDAALQAPLPDPLLPPELPWLYLIIPLPAAYLLGDDLAVTASQLLKAYLPFFGFGGSFHVVYRYLMPRLLRLTSSRGRRLLMHLAALLICVPVVATVLLPLCRLITDEPMQSTHFLIVSYIFSSACVLPGLAVQRLRQRAQSAEHRALSERKAALEAQLAALQARTDPHFLFNSINTVASLIPEDPELAERTLERLADLFRYALESSRLKTVKLTRELAMVSDYLALQSARFGPRLQTHLSVDAGLEDIDVPPLLLQPLVENAILHGLSQRRGGRVEIAVRRESSHVILEVLDDGPGPGRSSHAGTGTSVAGLSERLRLLYDARATLSLNAQPNGGCLARLLLPIASSS